MNNETKLIQTPFKNICRHISLLFSMSVLRRWKWSRIELLN